MIITSTDKSIIFEESPERITSILKEDIKIVFIGGGNVAVYDSQSRQQDAKRLIIDFKDVEVPQNVSSGIGLFDALEAFKGAKTISETNLEDIQHNTDAINDVKELLIITNKWLRKIYNPV